MQTRYMERSNSMARGKRPLDLIGSDEGQPEKKRPALASSRCFRYIYERKLACHELRVSLSSHALFFPMSAIAGPSIPVINATRCAFNEVEGISAIVGEV